MVLPDDVIAAALSIFVFLALCGALALTMVAIRRPSDALLYIAGALVVLCLIVVAVSPFNVPLIMGLVIALLGTALGVLGGYPITRRILDVATRGAVVNGDNGGIVLGAAPGGDADAPAREVMRGGTTIGYLERLSVVVAIVAGFPEAIAMVVAIKGIGRFSELATPEARERFIIGTLASLLWACVIGGLVRLAIW